MKMKSFLFTLLLASFVFLAGIGSSGQGVGKAKSAGSAIPGPLSKVHAGLSNSKDCIKCHASANGGEITPRKCLGCHKKLSDRITQGRGYHRDKKEDCALCHAEHQGRDSRLVELDIADFDHTETGFVLTGAHQRVSSCDRCHTGKNTESRQYFRSFLLKDNRCAACHTDQHRGNQPVCSDCHTTTNWRVEIW